MSKWIGLNTEQKKAYLEERDDRTFQVLSMQEFPQDINEKIFKTIEKEEWEVLKEIEEKLFENDEVEIA